MTSSIATLADLRAHFEQAVADRTLVITATNGVVARLTGFVASLPERRLILRAPSFRLTDTELTTEATADEQWPTSDTGDRPLHVTGVQLVFRRPPDFTVELTLTGTVTVDGRDLGVTGLLDPKDDRVTVTLPTGNPSRSLSLAALAGFVAGHALDEYLPVGVAVLATVPLSGLRMAFGYRAAEAMEITTTSTLSDATWPVVPDLITLKNIAVDLTSRSVALPQHRATVGGNVHGTVHIGQDFRVTAALTGDNAWTLEIVPADGDLLPGIDALARLAGGAEVAKQVTDGFQALGLERFSIDGVRIGFDLDTESLTHVAIRGSVTIDGLTCDVEIGLPMFSLQCMLSPKTPIDLKALVTKYFPGVNNFPAVAVTRLDIVAVPSMSHFELAAAIVGDWRFDVGPIPVGFHEFLLRINKNAIGVTGFISAGFSLFDADFEVIANNPTAGGGWQFTARSVPGKPLTIKAIHAHIAEMFGVDTILPAAIEGLSLANLGIWFDTSTGDFNFTCEADFPMDGTTVDITVTIRLNKTPTGYQKTFGGHVTVGTLVFDLAFQQDAASTVFAAVYSHTGAQQPLKIADLVAQLSASAAGLVPADLTIDLRDVVLAISAGTPPAFVLGLELSAELGLSELPLVGKDFPPDRKVGLDSLRVLVASRVFTVADIGAINKIMPATVPPLPDASKDATQDGAPVTPDAVALAAGVTVSARLLLGGTDTARTLSLPAGPVAPGTAVATSAGVPAVTASDDTRWFDVQRSFGPVYFDRIGLSYRNKTVEFLLDAALTAAGLTVSLDGLTLGSPVDHFSPTFDVRGLGIDYRNETVEIGGALLRTTVTENGVSHDEYDGAALIKAEGFTVAALGAYTYVGDAPSLFVYAVLDAALGGPPFFYVTGLAAGFGYNRAIVVPPVTGVADFPLVTAAQNPQPITGAANPRQLVQDAIAKMRTSIPPTPGALFLAAGIKFQSFRIIDSFALVVADFGKRLELAVLGLSTVVAPTPEAGTSVTPLAEMQLALKASFVPDEGFLGVIAQLTEASFLFSRNCHLTGGFAFYSWFSGEHAGDFVLSVGGYHPLFHPPANYPSVPRLGFNWHVDSQLMIKGDAYYALTPVALMAGVHLEAVWQSGNLRAAFMAGADFIVAWQPYFYDARAYVDINVSYTFEFFGTHKIEVDLGADLHLWGPEFAGTAHITLAIFSFDVAFGARTTRAPKPIGWSTFHQSFLPAAGQCDVAVSAGLLTKGTAATTDLGVLDAQRMVLLTNTVVPSTGAVVHGSLAIDHLYYTGDAGTPVFAPFTTTVRDTTPTQTPTDRSKPAGAVAVGPMGIKLPGHDGAHLKSTLTIAITRGTESMAHHFAFTPVLKHVPAGMWGELGEHLRPDPNDPTLVDDALVGFEIRPAVAPLEGSDPATAGDLTLFQYHLPTLPGGRYEVTVTQDVTTDDNEGDPTKRKIPPQRFGGGGDFTIAGTRPALAPDEVYAVYPPDGALGDYSTDLPHVILNHSTLPWQEAADPDRDDLPWLALLLFDDADRPTPQVTTVGQLRKPVPGVVFPPDSLGDTQADGDQVTVIDVPFAHLGKLLPAQDAHRRDLALLGHVRRGPDGTERAVIIGNRLPRVGAAHVAHLVSVRGRYTPSGFDPHGATDTSTVRLVSLASWRFTCTDTDQAALGLLRHVATRAGALRPTAADDRAEQGYLRIRHTTSTGDRQDAWYRGPLAPHAVPVEQLNLPAHSPADLIPPGATPDVSRATAWQLGQLLALRSKPFAAALYRWKRARAQLRKSGSTDTPPIPAAVTTWLNDIGLLRGVPFHHLVPDEAMLPVESVRFCSVDANWQACLLDGALSIGRVTGSDVKQDETLATDLRAVAGDALSPWTRQLLGAEGSGAHSGILLRSAVVAGWPDLVMAATAAGKAVDTVRQDTLSANTLFALFDGELTDLSIRFHTQVLHFGLGSAAEDWERDDRVVDMTAVATTRIGPALAAKAASAQLAAQLLAIPPHVDIHRPQ
ncbi:DUF6603 domain-containing protein [Saccharothrix isguenensis]